MRLAGMAIAVALTVAVSGCSLILSSSDDPDAGPVFMDAGEVLDADPNVPFLDGWERRRRLTVDPTAAGFEGFVLLVTLRDDAALSSGVSDPGGADIRFTEGDGTTVLPHSIQLFTPGTGDLAAWVRLSDSDDGLYLYYGNAGVSAANDSPWEDYAGVWHLDEDQPDAGTIGLFVDQANGNDADDGTDEPLASGQVVLAAPFGGDDGLVVPHQTEWTFDDGGLENGFDDMTITAWIDFTGTGDLFGTIVRMGATMPGDPGYWFAYQSSLRVLQFYAAGDSSRETTNSNDAMVILGGAWHHVAVTLDREPANDTVAFYLDGVPLGGNTFNTLVGQSMAGTKAFGIGADGENGARGFGGRIDELRVVKGVLPPEWITAMHENQLDPMGFVGVGDEQTAP